MGVEVKIGWDPSLLEFVSRVKMVGQPGGVLNPSTFEAKDINGTSDYWLASASMGDAWWGNGSVVKITFKVISQPNWLESKASCPLAILVSDLVDYDAKIVPHDTVDGYYEILPLILQMKPTIRVEPQKVTMGPEPAVGEQFIVEINLYNVTDELTGLYGVEIQFGWDNTLINHVFHETLIGQTGGVLNSPTFTAKDNVTVSGLDGLYWLVATSNMPAAPWFGDGTIARITFQVVYQPNLWESKASCDLEILYSDLVMYEPVVEIPHNAEDGYYEILPPVPSVEPIIKVEPAEIIKGPDVAIGQEFTIDVNLYNVTAENAPTGLYGVEVKLGWNSTLLELVSVDVRVGQTNGTLNSPVFLAKNENGTGYYWLVGASMGSPWWGNGTIVKLAFKVIYQKVEPIPSASCNLKILYSELVMYEPVVQIPHVTKDGYYEIDPVPRITSYTVTWNSVQYTVVIESDSVIIAPYNLDFNQTACTISFTAVSDGIFNVTIPKSLMSCDSLGQWVVTVDGSPPTTIHVTDNTTHTFVYFEFGSGTYEITIKSTLVIPEFSFISAILLIIMISCLIPTAKLLRRKEKSIKN
jgi:hypothetical protein